MNDHLINFIDLLTVCIKSFILCYSAMLQLHSNFKLKKLLFL